MRSTTVEAAVRHALRAAGLCRPGHTLVAALSGGADSVALLDALATLAGRYGFTVVAAHLDHGLRADSAGDAVFCERLCRRLGLRLVSGRADVMARARRDGGGLEQAARRERYAFLRSVRKAEGAALIAVAHTRDDQAETVLLRLLRGSGRTGLSAMRARRGAILRPLLAVSRRAVLAHLRARSLPWREDPTNSDTRLLRNRVRHELIPFLESRFNPAVRATLARAAAVVTAESELLDGLAGEVFARAVRREGAHTVVTRSALAAAPEALARLVVRKAIGQAGGLRGVGRVHVERLLGLACSPQASGRRLPLPGRRDVVTRFDELWIGPAQPAWVAFEAALGVPGRVELPDGRWLTARESSGSESGREGVVVAAPDEPLVVRTRRPGDRVRAGGRDRSLKRLLLESRVPADVRGRLPLVAAGTRVIWFPGLAPAATTAAGRYVALAVEPAGAGA